MPKPTANDRKAAFEEEFSRKAKAARITRESLVVYDSEEEGRDGRSKQSKASEHIQRTPTKVD